MTDEGQISQVNDVSAFGRVIVGKIIVDKKTSAAFLWNRKNGIRQLKSVLEKDFGLNLMTYRDPPDDGFYVLMAAPKHEVSTEEVVKVLAKGKDALLIDSPSGLGRDAIFAIKASKEMVLVITPDIAALSDAFKAKMIAERLGVKQIGVIMNPAFLT